MSDWRPIKTAPEQEEVLVWRDDCGVLMAQYTSLGDLITPEESEAESLGEEALWSKDWFGGDSIISERLEGDEAPTHWMPLPKPPVSNS